MTTTLFRIIQSELQKAGFNEFVNETGDLIFFEDEYQFMEKILSYDEDVSSIVNKLFTGVSLDDRERDEHFKRNFVNRFANRKINRQTIEAFRMELLSTFLTNQRYLNSVYSDIEKYILQESTSLQANQQKNAQTTDGSTLTDNRSAFANLPQNNVNLDTDNMTMTTANDNTVSRNKQTSDQTSVTDSSGKNTSDSKGYRLDELMKSNGLEEQIYNEFDRKCFMQIW